MVEIIPKKIPKIPQWGNILFYLSLALLIFSISSYFVLDNSFKERKNKLAELEEVLLKGRTAEDNVLENEILISQKKINDFSQLIEKYSKASGIFVFLQEKSHPQVFFSKFNLDLQKSQITLSGQTQSFKTLGQQLLIFKEEEIVRSANLEAISMNREGKVGFNLSLFLDPKIFK